MKSIVIYYSPTGNTRKVAKAIRKGMEQKAGKCDIAQVKDLDPSDVDQYDLIGLGSPVWMGCTFCEMICPTGAISGNWEQILKETAGLA